MAEDRVQEMVQHQQRCVRLHYSADEGNNESDFDEEEDLFGVGTRERYLSLLEFREVSMHCTSSTMFTSKEPLVWRRNWRANTRLQSHFENVQRVSDTVTLPYSMKYLRSRIAEDLDLSHLTEKLMQGKGLASSLSSKEKLELWEKLTVLSFMSTTASLWSTMMLCLYVRVQVNILGRHLYLEIARGSEGSHSQVPCSSKGV